MRYVGILFCFFLQGCISLLPEQADPPQLFQMTGTFDSAQQTQTFSHSLTLDEPYAIASLDSTKIAMEKNSGLLEYVSGAEWPDRLPLALQQIMLDSFEHLTANTSVQRAQHNAHGDLLLQTEIRHFQIVSQGSIVKVTLVLRLLDNASRKQLAFKEFSQSITIDDFSKNAVIKGFSKINQTMMPQIVSWCAGIINQLKIVS